MAGLLEGDYQAVLKAIGARQPDTATGDRAGVPRTPSVLDVAELLEPGPVPRAAVPEAPEPPPPWSGKLRLMEFDMPSATR